MIVLGINAYHGDASAALFIDGQLVAAAEEERFNRIKHAAGFPTKAVRYCLDSAGIGVQDVEHVAIPRDPRARLLKKALWAARLPHFARERLRTLGQFRHIGDALCRAMDVPPDYFDAHVHRVEHHRAHLASAFFTSPFDRAAVLSLDGFGDFGSGAWGQGEGTRITIHGGAAFPHSLGIAYTALSQFLGFPKYGDEYKVMGLAAYAEPQFLEKMRHVVRTDGGIGYALDLKCFTHHKTGPGMRWDWGEPTQDPLWSIELVHRFGPARAPDAPLTPRHRAVAASLQTRLEEIVLGMARGLYERTRLDALAYAGGVAYNCVANGKLVAETPIEWLSVHPAAGDAGLAIGAALSVWHETLDMPRQFVMEHAAWGPEYDVAELEHALEVAGVRYTRVPDDEVSVVTARDLAWGNIVGWFQGRAEWGPRALGQRSILADPRDPEMKDRLNRRVKHREPFRPFAPSVLEERIDEWFESAHPSPFMLLAYEVKPSKRKEIPATTHVDGTARLQTVNRAALPLYWSVLSEFEKLTGVPVLLNTSFNENEPLVNTPEEAVACFQRTDMDVLVMGPFVARKVEPGT